MRDCRWGEGAGDDPVQWEYHTQLLHSNIHPGSIPQCLMSLYCLALVHTHTHTHTSRMLALL